MEEIEKRKEIILNFFKKSKIWIYIILIIILGFGFYIRTSNLENLKDVTTGKWIPGPEADTFLVLRYVEQILQYGHLLPVDNLRYYPLGYVQAGDWTVLPYFIAYLYKLFSFFNPSISVEYVHVIYPVLCFVVSMFFFFLLLNKLFNFRIALLGTFLLTVSPAYLHRTMAGFSDKESLALMFMYMALYFYVFAWKSEKLKINLIFGALSGIFTGLMGWTWGGSTSLFMIFGFFAFIEILLDKFDKKDFYIYTFWFIGLFCTLFIPSELFNLSRFSLISFFFSFTTMFIALAFLMGLFNILFDKYNFFNVKEKIKNKLPFGFFLFLLAFIFGVVIYTAFTGDPTSLVDKIFSVFKSIIFPFADRWSMTVAESHQPYVTDWISQLGKWAFWLFIFGSVALFYNMVKPIKQYKWPAVIIYTLFIFGLIFSRYSSSGSLNGETFLAKSMFFGSLFIFIFALGCFYLYTFNNKKEVFNEILKIDKTYTLIFIWLFIMVISSRLYIRLLVLLVPIASIMVAYLFNFAYERIAHLSKKEFKILGYIVLLVILIPLLFGMSKVVMAQAKYTGPMYNVQWQVAMDWVRKNTDENAVFAHWWDYGYLVQYGGRRATLSDGGNARGAINYFIGRHLLTAQSEEEALELLKANNATHVLIISDEIGKYGAYSVIGSDENYDRFSWINIFSLDQTQTVKTRDKTMYLYVGGYPLDEDFIYEGKLFPRKAVGIAGFVLPITEQFVNGSSSAPIIEQPIAVVIYNNQRYDIPLECIFFNGREITFDKKGLNGCLIIIPELTSTGGNPINYAMYLSRRVRSTFFAQYYLMGKESPNFEIAYTDKSQMPLGLYGGRIIGPLKIWKVNYPSYVKDNPLFRGTELPSPEVAKIRKELM